MQKRMSDELIRRCTIAPYLHQYGQQHLETVQNFYDCQYGGKYRIVVLNAQCEILWKASINQQRKHTITLLNENHHYDVLLNVGLYFRGPRRNFCVDCETFYERAAFHDIHCKAKCGSCGHMMNGHCLPQLAVSILCQKCLKHFDNEECYQRHLKQMCGYYGRCDKCNSLYNKRFTHVCGEKFCKTCDVFHDPERPCYIQQLELSEHDDRHKRIIVFDIEVRNVKKNIKKAIKNYRLLKIWKRKQVHGSMWPILFL